MQAKKLGNFSGNDIELCRTTNTGISNRMAQLLLEEQIPFTKNCRRVPFFRREKYDGARRVYVISINPHRYGQARRAIDTMELSQRKRLVLSNY
jgi:hypothetical protein